MIKKLLFLTIILITFKSQVYSQGSLTLDNLITIYSGDLDQINTILSNKGWILKDTESDIDSLDCGQMETISWAYRPDENGKAYGFAYLNKYEFCSNRVGYQVFNKSAYDIIRNQILKIGMKRIGSESGKTDDGIPYIATSFLGAKFKIVILNASTTNDSGELSSSYLIYLYKRAEE